jgi:hypothetical protein
MNGKSFIRVRDHTGKASRIDAGMFVEICDEEGRIGALIYRTSQGAIRVVQPNDEKEVGYYSNLFDVQFCTKVKEVTKTVNDNAQKTVRSSK